MKDYGGEIQAEIERRLRSGWKSVPEHDLRVDWNGINGPQTGRWVLGWRPGGQESTYMRMRNGKSVFWWSERFAPILWRPITDTDRLIYRVGTDAPQIPWTLIHQVNGVWKFQ